MVFTEVYVYLLLKMSFGNLDFHTHDIDNLPAAFLHLAHPSGPFPRVASRVYTGDNWPEP